VYTSGSSKVSKADRTAAKRSSVQVVLPLLMSPTWTASRTFGSALIAPISSLNDASWAVP